MPSFSARLIAPVSRKPVKAGKELRPGVEIGEKVGIPVGLHALDIECLIEAQSVIGRRLSAKARRSWVQRVSYSEMIRSVSLADLGELSIVSRGRKRYPV